MKLLRAIRAAFYALAQLWRLWQVRRELARWQKQSDGVVAYHLAMTGAHVPALDRIRVRSTGEVEHRPARRPRYRTRAQQLKFRTQRYDAKLALRRNRQ